MNKHILAKILREKHPILNYLKENNIEVKSSRIPGEHIIMHNGKTARLAFIATEWCIIYEDDVYIYTSLETLRMILRMMERDVCKGEKENDYQY